MSKRIAITLGILVLLGSLAFVSRELVNRERVINVATEQRQEASEDIAVLVLGHVGVGQGGTWHFSPNLTDSIVLIYYKAQSNTINLISLPRDLYGEFGGKNLRINRVFMDGKIEDLMKTMPEITGVEVDKYVVLDLALVSEAIDSLGGIDIDLPSKVVDPVSGFTLQAGPQRLDGEDVIWLIRNRFAPQGDFFREKNQHLVVEAAFAKFKDLSALRKTVVAFRLLPELSKSKANFNINDLFYEFRGIKEVNFNSIVLDFSTGLLVSSTLETPSGEKAYILVPKVGANNYSEIKKFIEERMR